MRHMTHLDADALEAVRAVEKTDVVQGVLNENRINAGRSCKVLFGETPDMPDHWSISNEF